VTENDLARAGAYRYAALARDLVTRPRGRVDLVGPGGLLAGLTKTVLEAALEADMAEHRGYDEQTRPAVTAATPVTAPSQDGVDRGGGVVVSIAPSLPKCCVSPPSRCRVRGRRSPAVS